MKSSPAGSATCSNCGSVYTLMRMALPSRDRDHLNCDVCGSIFFSWKEAACYTDKLVSRGIAPPTGVK